jgi:exodeoxyribonuclease VII large subunit
LKKLRYRFKASFRLKSNLNKYIDKNMSDIHELYEAIPKQVKPCSVSELNKNAKLALEQCFPSVYVTGEISNCMRPRSGHYYFSLKDSNAQISCAMFKGYQDCITAPLEDGMQVNIRGKLSIYPDRGNYQLIATHLEQDGDGKLREQFEALKAKLNAEGLFAEDLKKTIPKYPKAIGVVTSPTGAAIQDILKVLQHRYKNTEVIIYPALVQGLEAKHEIVKAIETANNRQECDVLIVARGGGSYEDLWAFNEEIVARAIYNTSIPVISGVGHEIDFTIADLVSDVRAATPSQAAQFATPDLNELLQLTGNYKLQLEQYIKSLITNNKMLLENYSNNIKHPLQKIETWSQILDNCDHSLQHSWKVILSSKNTQLKEICAKIEALSPMKTLQRGYSISTINNKPINSVKDINIDDDIDIIFKDGSITTRVLTKDKN